MVAEITHMLAADNFLCYHHSSEYLLLSEKFSQRENATWQYGDSGILGFSKWPNDRMAALVKHC